MKSEHKPGKFLPPQKKRSKTRIWLIVLLAVVVLILAAACLLYWYFHQKYEKIYVEQPPVVELTEDYEETVQANKEFQNHMEETIAQEQLEERTAIKAKGEIVRDRDVINILLIGTDERTAGDYSENARGDACMLMSVNTNGDVPMISLVSMERGMGVPILDGPYEGQWDWLTHTFRYGGGELLVREVSECLKVDVEYYVRINFNYMKQAIDAMGGVTVYFDEAEAEAFRDMGLETAVVGNNHLDGVMALKYARLRHIDSDWVRIQRQREIVIAALKSCRNKSLEELDQLVDTILPMVRTNIPEAKLAELLLLLPVVQKAETQQMTIPVQGSYGHMTGMGGRSLFAVDFETNAQILHDFLYEPKLEE